MGGERDKWEAQTQPQTLAQAKRLRIQQVYSGCQGPSDAVSLIRAMSIALRPRHQEGFLGSAQGWDEVISARRQGGKEGGKKRRKEEEKRRKGRQRGGKEGGEDTERGERRDEEAGLSALCTM